MPHEPHVPTYCRQRHRDRADQAFVVLNGVRHWLGIHDSRDSKARYQKLVAEWLAGGGEVPPPSEDIRIMELLANWLAWADRRYHDVDDKHTTRFRNAKHAVRLLRDLSGESNAADFGPRCLKAVQQAMVKAGYARSYVNNSIDAIRHVFRWAVAEELVESEVYQALRAVGGYSEAGLMRQSVIKSSP